MKPYKSPILVSVLKVIALLYGLATILVILAGVFGGILGGDTLPLIPFVIVVLTIGVLAVILVLGIAQVIDFLGRTAYHTEATADAIGQLVYAQRKTMQGAPHSKESAGVHSPEKTAHNNDMTQDPVIIEYLKKKAEREHY